MQGLVGLGVWTRGCGVLPRRLPEYEILKKNSTISEFTSPQIGQIDQHSFCYSFF